MNTTKNTMKNGHIFQIMLTELWYLVVLDQEKTNALLNLINEQDDIDKIYLYAKDLSKLKHEFLIKKHENTGIKHLNGPNSFIEC